ncbi:MAG: tetratricopeptide repeat protein [Pseudomonadota bacterium]
MNITTIGTRAALLLCLASPTWAASPIDAAARAEGEQRWADAARYYREALGQQPDDVGLWKRLSDVEARRGQPLAAAQALDKAASLRPQDGALAFDASRAWAQADKPAEALAACRRADSLRPGEEEILRTCASQANWVGDSAQSVHFWRALLAKHAGKPEDRRQYAQALGWSGELDEAVRVYRDYLADAPQDAEAWLDYAKVQSWRGDYAAADAALSAYRERFGETREWHAVRARMLAWADWPDAAAAHADPLLASAPDDYELNYTRTLILRNDRQPDAALASLDRVQALRPESRDTLVLVRATRTAHRPAVSAGATFYSDADDIDIARAELGGVLPLNARTALLAGVGTESNKTVSGSPFLTLDGERRATLSDGWLGARHRFSPALGMEARVGAVHMDDYGERLIATLRADLRPSDQLNFVLLGARAPFTPSPLAVSHAVMANQIMAQAYWRPTLSSYVDAYVARADLSDGNRRSEFYLAPRLVVLRGQSLNLDAGVSGHWMDYARQLGHGYYDPDDYRRYAVNLYGYWKISDDDGISLKTSLGWHKDAGMTDYKFGEDVVLEGFLGIYRNTYVHAQLGYAGRSQTTGSYDAWSFMLNLTQRF